MHRPHGFTSAGVVIVRHTTFGEVFDPWERQRWGIGTFCNAGADSGRVVHLRRPPDGGNFIGLRQGVHQQHRGPTQSRFGVQPCWW